MKYKVKKYNIGEVAKYYGMTVDALRLYDKKGILSPSKDDDTNYRIYDRGDFVTMDYVMRMKTLDLSLDNIKTMLNDQTLKEMSNVVKGQKTHIEDEIASLQDKLVLIKDYEKLLKDSMENLEKPQIKTSPVFISQSIKTTMAQTMKDFGCIKKESIPLLTARISQKTNFEENFRESIMDVNFRQEVIDYLVTMPDYGNISRGADFPKDKFDVIPPRRCVYSIAYDHTNVKYDSFKVIESFLKDNDLTPSGFPLLRIIAIEKNRTTSAEYYELWLPIE